MIQYIKTYLPQSFVIADNVATPEAVHFLEDAGADATKVGIGPGHACITKIKTGFGTYVRPLKQHTNQLLQMEESAPMAILPNHYVLESKW